MLKFDTYTLELIWISSAKISQIYEIGKRVIRFLVI